MATANETVEFILGKLRHPDRFLARRMFGEFGLYADGKMVAVVCNDRLYVKVAPASAELEAMCEKGEPYPRAKLHYLVEESHLSTIPNLPAILLGMAEATPEKKTGRRESRG